MTCHLNPVHIFSLHHLSLSINSYFGCSSTCTNAFFILYYKLTAFTEKLVWSNWQMCTVNTGLLTANLCLFLELNNVDHSLHYWTLSCASFFVFPVSVSHLNVSTICSRPWCLSLDAITNSTSIQLNNFVSSYSVLTISCS